MLASVLVLDTNEYINALGFPSNPHAKTLLTIITKNPSQYSLCIPRKIIKEVQRNVHFAIFSEFMKIIHSIARIDEDAMVPAELSEKYSALGLKPADAFIAGYCEWVKADFLVTENRHFLVRTKNLPFEVVTAQDVLTKM